MSTLPNFFVVLKRLSESTTTYTLRIAGSGRRQLAPLCRCLRMVRKCLALFRRLVHSLRRMS